MATLPEIVCAADWAVLMQHLDQPGGTPQTLSAFVMDIRDAATVDGNTVVQFGAAGSGKAGLLTFDGSTKVLTASLTAAATKDLRPFAGKPLSWDAYATVAGGPRRRIGAGQATVVANVTAVSA